MTHVKKLETRYANDLNRPRELIKMEKDLLKYYEAGLTERKKNLSRDRLSESPIFVDLTSEDEAEVICEKNTNPALQARPSPSDLRVKNCETRTAPKFKTKRSSNRLKFNERYKRPTEKVVVDLDQLFKKNSSNYCTSSISNATGDALTSSSSTRNDSSLSSDSSTKSDDTGICISSHCRSDTIFKKPCSTQKGNFVFVTNNQIPGPDSSDFLKKLALQKVALETLVVEGNVMKGTIQTVAKGPGRYVHIRYTFDKWVTFKEQAASYLPKSSDECSDLFACEVELPEKSPGIEIMFYVRCGTDGEVFSDKNNGRCYTVRCMYVLESDYSA